MTKTKRKMPAAGQKMVLPAVWPAFLSAGLAAAAAAADLPLVVALAATAVFALPLAQLLCSLHSKATASTTTSHE